MNKLRTDPKVKKTLVRNYEVKVRPGAEGRVSREVETVSIPTMSSRLTAKENVLSEPTLCSSAVLANYLSDVKNTSPPALLPEDLNVNKGEMCAKMTKQLNFHFNDKIYRNLIELNANVKELKTRKDKRPTSTISVKKDLEPNIEDFCEDVKEPDSPPKIPAIKPKFRPIKIVEDGDLHKKVASFEIL